MQMSAIQSKDEHFEDNVELKKPDTKEFIMDSPFI